MTTTTTLEPWQQRLAALDAVLGGQSMAVASSASSMMLGSLAVLVPDEQWTEALRMAKRRVREMTP